LNQVDDWDEDEASDIASESFEEEDDQGGGVVFPGQTLESAGQGQDSDSDHAGREPQSGAD